MDFMDFTLQWAAGVCKETLPAPVLALINDYLLDPRSPAQYIRRQVSTIVATAAYQISVILAPVMDRVGQALVSSPDLVVLAFLAVVLLVLVQVLAYIQRVMLFWTRLAFRMVFWASVALFAAIVWQRGLAASLNDLMVLASKIVGFVAGVGDVFMSEYRRYEQLERTKRQSNAWKARNW